MERVWGTIFRIESAVPLATEVAAVLSILALLMDLQERTQGIP
jgi:hypothetical protein